MKRVVTEQKLGFVATVGSDGTPTFRPRATMLVLDDDHIMFGEIRSPRRLPIFGPTAMEINFIDQFARKGYRFKGAGADGRAGERRVHDAGAALCPFRRARRKDQSDRHPQRRDGAGLTTPAYDVGATEPELRAHWRGLFREPPAEKLTRLPGGL